MNISDKGIELIKKFEGCELKAYYDAVGVLTIGWGWTQKVDGKPITKGMTISQATADRLLRCGVIQYEQDVSKLVRVPLNQNQFDALVSFTYNVGAKALSGSTLLSKLNAGDYPGAADELLKWVYGNKVKLSGLVTRRKAEREMFLRGNLVASAIADIITSGAYAVTATGEE